MNFKAIPKEIPFHQIKKLMETFYRLTQVPITLVDSEANVIWKFGWTEICEKFNYSTPEAIKKCMAGNLQTVQDVGETGWAQLNCPNGLHQIAFPVKIAKEHFATLILGQFFFDDEKLDFEFFKSQASQSNFAIDEYLDALKKAPKFNRVFIERVIEYVGKATQFFSELIIEKVQLEKEMEKRRQAEAELRSSEQRFRSLTENNPDPIARLSTDMIIQYANDGVTRFTDRDIHSLVGKKISEVDFPPGVFEQFQGLCSKTYETGITQRMELELIEGVWFDCLVMPELSHTENNKIVTVSARDITDLKKVEAQLRESEQKYRYIAENASDVIWVRDLSDTERMPFVYASPALNRIFGYDYEEGMKLTPADVIAPEDFSKVMGVFFEEFPKAMAEQAYDRTWVQECGHIHKSGKIIPVEMSVRLLWNDQGLPYAMLGITRDISERKRIETARQEIVDRAMETQKMEAVGRLAGGVAHDFNNILTGINGYAEMLIASLAPEDPMSEDLRAILDAGNRAARLTNQLLTFGRKQIIAPRQVDLNELVQNAKLMLERIVGEDTRLIFEPAGGLRPVSMDPGQVDQILVNLTLNARDAMSEGGTLYIRTSNVDALPEDKEVDPQDWTHGGVLLEMEDQGHGIAEELLDHIFEPFFSTKDRDRGTGMGLATVYGIIKQNKGFIQVESQLDRGTCFRIYLPAEEAVRISHEKISIPAPLEVSETILVVEDEKVVRDLAQRILKRYGYNVLVAEDGYNALEVIRSHKGPLNLLLTDIIMPRMNGRQLYEKSLEIIPDLKVVYMSGYTEDVIAAKDILDSGTNFLQKPFNIHSMTKLVRNVLDS